MGRVPKIIAANWKMNLAPNEAEKLASEILKSHSDNSCNNQVILLPPNVYLTSIRGIISNSAIKLGGQDCHFEDKGAFTGDTSPAMLKNIGCEYAIVGHSERREHHKESDELINKKAKAAISNNLTPIICVGEKLQEREAGKHKEIVSAQLKTILSSIDADKVIIAYEPVWAIGTGKTAKAEEIAEIHDFIKPLIKTAPLLYGGSVNDKNYKEILDINNVDGLLIGGASLIIEKFTQIMCY